MEPIVEVAAVPAPPVIEQAMESMNSEAAAHITAEAPQTSSDTVPDSAPESAAWEQATSGEIHEEERLSDPWSANQQPLQVQPSLETKIGRRRHQTQFRNCREEIIEASEL